MFATYLRRELAGRRRQTIIVAVGMALAIALVVLVNSIAAGMKDAQASALESVYGVGTDITVSQAPAAPGEDGGGGPQRFEFGADAGTTEDGTTSVAQSRLTAGFGTSTFDASALATVQDVDDVSAAAAVLSLQNVSFSGELPDMSQRSEGMPPGQGVEPPTGGADGAGGSAFDVDSFSVLGIDPSGDAVGPLSAVEVTEGRALEAADVGRNVALLDASYATSAELAVGDVIDVGGTAMEIVGLLASTSTSAQTASDAYIPLDVAQTLAGLEDQISEIYVQAASASDLTAVADAIGRELPDSTVSTQEDLASSVSGSLGTATGLMGSLGLWLSIGVLAAAVLLAALFTVSGVSRRTREFGTLKAIGWSGRRIVGQVAAESLVQALIGGLVGALIGIVGVLVVNSLGLTLGASTAGAATAPAGGGPQMPGGPFGDAVRGAGTTDIVLGAPLSIGVVLLAIGLAAAGGLIAGALGGWRASRLRPADALRAIA